MYREYKQDPRKLLTKPWNEVIKIIGEGDEVFIPRKYPKSKFKKVKNNSILGERLARLFNEGNFKELSALMKFYKVETFEFGHLPFFDKDRILKTILYFPFGCFKNSKARYWVDFWVTGDKKYYFGTIRMLIREFPNGNEVLLKKIEKEYPWELFTVEDFIKLIKGEDNFYIHKTENFNSDILKLLSENINTESSEYPLLETIHLAKLYLPDRYGNKLSAIPPFPTKYKTFPQKLKNQILTMLCINKKIKFMHKDLIPYFVKLMVKNYYKHMEENICKYKQKIEEIKNGNKEYIDRLSAKNGVFIKSNNIQSTILGAKLEMGITVPNLEEVKNKYSIVPLMKSWSSLKKSYNYAVKRIVKGDYTPFEIQTMKEEKGKTYFEFLWVYCVKHKINFMDLYEGKLPFDKFGYPILAF